MTFDETDRVAAESESFVKQTVRDSVFGDLFRDIIIRALMYMGRSYQLYFKDQNADLYGSKKVFLPKPELYVIYVGDEKDQPGEITLSEEFFDGQETAIDVKVKVICESGSRDIINQYIIFTKVYGEQRRRYGRTRKAILETIRICKDRDVLKEYLESREKEVVDIMMTLFDEQEIYETHFKSVGREFQEKGRIEGLIEGRNEGLAEGRNEEREKIVLNAYNNGNSPEQIAMFIGVPLTDVQRILSSRTDK